MPPRLIHLAALGLFLLPGAGALHAAESQAPAGWKPVASTQSGLLLEPPLDLSWFTTDEFERVSATVGPEKIRKTWTTAVTALPPHPRPEVKGLTEQEVEDYMGQVRRLFDEGAANPVSDVGLISTQEDAFPQRRSATRLWPAAGVGSLHGMP